MKTDRERAPLILRRTTRGLEPQSQVDADLLAGIPMGADVEVTVKKRRSLPQNRLYWRMLQDVVEATGSYPTAEHLHDAIKMALGFTMPMKTLAGEIVFIPDSTAFGKMDADRFKTFFDSAAALIAERFGYDPLAQYEAGRKAA